MGMMKKRIKVIFVLAGFSAATLIPISTASAADAAVVRSEEHTSELQSH